MKLLLSQEKHEVTTIITSFQLSLPYGIEPILTMYHCASGIKTGFINGQKLAKIQIYAPWRPWGIFDQKTFEMQKVNP